jgi:hypothetical protein
VLVRAFGAAAALLLVAANTYAAKSDVVVLQNGDRLTGEVKELARGQLKLDTDDAGTIYIEWHKIATLTTAGRYEVGTRDGRYYVGTLAPDTSGLFQVIADDGTITKLAYLEAVSAWSIESGFFQQIEGTLDVGGSFTKSAGVGEISIDLEAARRRPGYDAFTDFSSNLTRQRESSTSTRFTWLSGYTHFRADRWFFRPFLFVERNPGVGLTLRTSAAMSVGRYLQRSNRSTTLVTVGAAAGREWPTDRDAIPNLDALVTFATSFYQYNYPRTTVDLSVMIFPELNHWGRVRTNANVKLKRELVRDFTASVSLDDTFDSQPQVPDVSRHDVGITLSLGWMF